MTTTYFTVDSYQTKRSANVALATIVDAEGVLMGGTERLPRKVRWVATDRPNQSAPECKCTEPNQGLPAAVGVYQSKSAVARSLMDSERAELTEWLSASNQFFTLDTCAGKLRLPAYGDIDVCAANAHIAMLVELSAAIADTVTFYAPVYGCTFSITNGIIESACDVASLFAANEDMADRQVSDLALSY